MADHADNGRPGGVAPAEAFPDRILVGPILPSEIFVNDGHGLRAHSVLTGEKPPALKRNAHGFKVSGRHPGESAVRSWVAGAHRAIVDLKR